MRVTDEMLRSALCALDDRAVPAGNVSSGDVRAALETALADVPEPDERYELLFQDYTAADADRRTLAARTAELEAQLAEQRRLNREYQKHIHGIEKGRRYAGEHATERETRMAQLARRIAELEAKLKRVLSDPTAAEEAAATEALARSYEHGGGTDEVMAYAAVSGFLGARRALLDAKEG